VPALNWLIGRRDTFDYRARWERSSGGWICWTGTVYRRGDVVSTPSGSLSPGEGDNEFAISAAVRLGMETVIDSDKWRWR
jgi:hypothetical protein